MADRKVKVAIIGLGFGAEFIPIYQKHPNADMYAIPARIGIYPYAGSGVRVGGGGPR